MDLQDQLQKLFPDHKPLKDINLTTSQISNLYNQVSPLLCKYEKRNGRPTLIIEGFEGANKNHLKKSMGKNPGETRGHLGSPSSPI